MIQGSLPGQIPSTPQLFRNGKLLIALPVFAFIILTILLTAIFGGIELLNLLEMDEKTVIKYKKALVKCRLIIDKRVGQGNPNRIYVLKPELGKSHPNDPNLNNLNKTDYKEGVENSRDDIDEGTEEDINDIRKKIKESLNGHGKDGPKSLNVI